MIVITGHAGRLGNRLRTFAHVVAIARETSHDVMNPGFAQYGRYFPAFEDDPWCRHPRRIRSRRWRSRLKERADDHFKLGAVEGLAVFDLPRGTRFELDNRRVRKILRKNDLVILNGFNFRHMELTKHRDEIIELFTPHRRHHDAVMGVVDPLREKAGVVVGIHIRRGDFARYLQGAFFFEVAQYLPAMRHMQTLFDEPVAYVVCSDEPLDETIFAEFSVRFGTGNEVEDLYALARCDYLIGPPSTYTEWASYYGLVRKYSLKDPDATFSLDDFVLYDDLIFKPRGFTPARQVGTRSESAG
ncbi:MAG TPA: hypothetical protein VE174_07655 [Actinomycetota bacterium]|nr:hypothetical protein [Actinomycetota bacterium]